MACRLQQRHTNDEDTNILTNEVSALQIELLFPDRSTASLAT